jgi:hypothetical protein
VAIARANGIITSAFPKTEWLSVVKDVAVSRILGSSVQQIRVLAIGAIPVSARAETYRRTFIPLQGAFPYAESKSSWICF